MKIHILFWVVILWCRLLSQVHAQQATMGPEKLTNANVVALVSAGLPLDIITAKIEATPCAFDVSTNGLLALKQAHVPDNVLKAMLAKAASHPVAAPSTPPSPLPRLPIANRPYLYQPATSTWVPLEKTVSTMRMKLVGLGYGGAKSAFQIAGTTSPTRLPRADSTVFWLNTGGGSAPDFVLYHALAEKGSRTAIGAKYSLGKTNISQDVVLFNVLPAGNGLFRLVPSQKLPPGEYFFTAKPSEVTVTADAYAFGID